MNTKPFWKSWVIVLTAIPMITEIVNYCLTQPFIPEKYKGVLTLVSGILVIVARVQSKGEKITATNDQSSN